MSNKKHIISTSTIIALTLFNAGAVEATNQDSSITDNQVVNIQELVSLETTVAEHPQFFPNNIEELEFILTNDSVRNLFEQAVSSIEQGDYNQTVELYDNMLIILEQNEVDTTIVGELLALVSEASYVEEYSAEVEEKTKVAINLEEQDTLESEENIDEIDSDEEIEVSVEEKETLTAATFSAQSNLKTADNYVTNYQKAYFTSDLYQITLDFKAQYPNDPRLVKMIEEVAIKNYSEGLHNHRIANYTSAVIYYKRILKEESINVELRNRVNYLINLAEAKEAIKSADDFYKEYQEAYYVSNLWEIAQSFKVMYPGDSRLVEVINDAAVKNIAEGQGAHRDKKFELALVYYSRVASEALISKDVRDELTVYMNQAENKEVLKNADNYYNEYKKAYYVSELWTIAQSFKKDFPNDKRVSEVINDAARNNMIEGQRAHRKNDFKLALTYYNRVLEENLIQQSIRQELNVFVNQAESNSTLKTANDFYNDYKKTYYVSELWTRSQAFKNDFPHDLRVKELVNDAARNNMAEGQRAHRRNDYALALIYYNRVLEEALVDAGLKAEIRTYVNQAYEKRSLKTPEDYVIDYNNSYYVSNLWSISQNFKKDFPNDLRVFELVNDAALDNLAEGKRAHLRSDYETALIYYNRVLAEELVKSSVQSEINTYLKQATGKRALKTPTDYIIDYSKAYYVSDLWNISQLFKTDFPEDSRLIDVINNAAESNLNEGLNNHRKKNYKNAAIYYDRVNSESLVDVSIRNKAEAYYYLAENNMNLTNIIVRGTKYDISLKEMIDVQFRHNPQIWDTVKGNPFRNATKSELEKYVNPANSLPSDLSTVNYLLSTLEVSASILNVRSGPGTNYEIVGKASRGDRYTILHKDQVSGWYKISFNGQDGWVAGTSAYVERTNILQHLKLSGSSGISVADLNKELEDAGILEGMGATFRKASQEANVNELYLIAHALLESGHGTSKLATGIQVNGRTVYNMFGIGAFDNNANKFGSERAYELGWFTPEAAIIGGANWISNGYINNPTYRQDTLYKMRWNPASPGTHQYATDVRWAEGQMNTLDSIVLLAQKYDLILNFDAPLYN